MLYNVVLVSAVAILQSFTLLDPVDCSMPGRSGLHHLLEFAQTHVHRVSDAIPPSHPLSSPFPPGDCNWLPSLFGQLEDQSICGHEW